MWGIKPKEFHKLKRFKEFFKYNTQQHQEELVFDEEEKSVLDWLIIRHQGWPWKVWSMLVLAAEMVSGYIYAFFSAYRESGYERVWVPFELMFLVDMLLHFTLDFNHNKMSLHATRDYELIIFHYIKGDFMWDLIPLIPFQMLSLKNNA
jgi:hypothetical protein